jgi:hypothetical protein
VDILYDPHDDLRRHEVIRRWCRRRRDHLVVSLPPEVPERHIDASTMPTWTLLAVYQALGEPLRPDGSELFRRLHRPDQPPLFPELDLTDRIARYQTLARYLGVDEVGDLLIRAGIRHLYVLQAEALTSGTWHWLCELTRPGGIRLHLVVGGRDPHVAQVRALEGCRIQRRIAPPSRRPVWWDRPNFRSPRRRPSAPERMTMPRRSRRAPRGYDRAISAPEPRTAPPPPSPVPEPPDTPRDRLGHGVPPTALPSPLSALTPAELRERFRTAAQALVADNPERSFISILTPPQPSPEGMAARQERTLAAFAKLVARMGDRVQEFFPIPPPGGRAGGDEGREEDQER